MKKFFNEINLTSFTQFDINSLIKLTNYYKLICINNYGVLECTINGVEDIVHFYIREDKYYYHTPKDYLLWKIIELFKDMIKNKADKKDICKVLNISNYQYNKYLNSMLE